MKLEFELEVPDGAVDKCAEAELIRSVREQTTLKLAEGTQGTHSTCQCRRPVGVLTPTPRNGVLGDDPLPWQPSLGLVSPGPAVLSGAIDDCGTCFRCSSRCGRILNRTAAWTSPQS